MKTHLILLFFSVLALNSFGQIAHDLEVFSEDGVKFTLILNGRVMNEQPMSNIQVVNTDKDYLNLKIKFEDQMIPDIERSMLQIANPGTDVSVRNIPVSVVYKIVEKKGQYKLRFASRSEKKIQDQPDYIFIENNGVYQVESGFKVIIRW